MEYTDKLREWRLGLAGLLAGFGRLACWLRLAGLLASAGWLALAGRSAAEKKEGLSQ